MDEKPTVRQTLAGVRDAVVVYGHSPFTKVEVKELSKEQIPKLAREWDFIPINATPFYHSRGNFERLLELVEEGKLVRCSCEGTAFELPEKQREDGERRKREFEDIRNRKEWRFSSMSKRGKFYTVKHRKYNGRTILSCDCPCWIYNTRGDRTCPHTDQVSRWLA